MSTTGEVLVLDDEFIVCQRVKEQLEREGFSVQISTESADALSRLAEKSFDVVVTDIKMKGPTGLDVLRYVRQHSPATQVVVITGYGTLETAKEAEVVGAFALVHKPFQLDEICKLVRQAAKKTRKLR